MEIIDVDGHVNDIADQGKVQIDSAEKPSVHPSRASGRTEEPLIFGDFSIHAETCMMDVEAHHECSISDTMVAMLAIESRRHVDGKPNIYTS
jgi:hypothetical protein